MKIEKINENQIRCTLDSEDLISRDIRLSELAYGTDKARELFQDLVREAGEQVGFDTDDIPLMIEAVPINKECIVLIITKVEDPEEMDTRFANYAPSVQYEDPSPDDEYPEDSDEVTAIFRRFQQGEHGLMPGQSKPASRQGNPGKIAEPAARREKTSLLSKPEYSMLVWSFSAMHDVIGLAKMLGEGFDAPNTLYKDPSDGRLVLSVRSEGLSQEVTRRVLSLLSEYGHEVTGITRDPAFLTEHYSTVIQDNALQKLAMM